MRVCACIYVCVCVCAHACSCSLLQLYVIHTYLIPMKVHGHRLVIYVWNEPRVPPLLFLSSLDGSFPATDPSRKTNSDFPEFCLKCLWTVSGEKGRTPHGSPQAWRQALGGKGNWAGGVERGREALERSSRSSEKFTQPDPEIGEPKVPISCVARGAVNLARTQIKFLARRAAGTEGVCDQPATLRTATRSTARKPRNRRFD